MAEVFLVIRRARYAGVQDRLLIDRAGTARTALFDENVSFDQVSLTIDRNWIADWDHVFNPAHGRAPWLLCRRAEEEIPDFGLLILHYLHPYPPMNGIATGIPNKQSGAHRQ